MSIIFLIGMPYAGKTYWGERIAVAYNRQFADTDNFIETQYGKSIPAIFEEEGEEAFRLKEKNALLDIIDTAGSDTIVACGGGTPVFYNNLQLMKNAGCVVYLQAALGTLLERAKQDATERPLLQNEEEIKEKLESLLRDRIPFFEQADHILQAEDVSVLNFEKIIHSCTNRQ